MKGTAMNAKEIKKQLVLRIAHFDRLYNNYMYEAVERRMSAQDAGVVDGERFSRSGWYDRVKLESYPYSLRCFREALTEFAVHQVGMNKTTVNNAVKKEVQRLIIAENKNHLDDSMQTLRGMVHPMNVSFMYEEGSGTAICSAELPYNMRFTCNGDVRIREDAKIDYPYSWIIVDRVIKMVKEGTYKV